jgi:methylmalonyl-CoA/ethylmalonyl-CoA epimerase
MAAMTQPAEIAQAIGLLADADSGERTHAAQQLWWAGMKLVSPLLSRWMQDAELRRLLQPPRKDQNTRERSPQLAAVTIGIAVQPDRFEGIRRANGSPPLADVPPDQDALEFELAVGNLEFDVLTSREPGGAGAIAKYLQKQGEGIQQVEVLCSDVDRATAILRQRFEIAPIYPAARAGANGTRVNFFLAPAPEGKKVLVELVESKGLGAPAQDPPGRPHPQGSSEA